MQSGGRWYGVSSVAGRGGSRGDSVYSVQPSAVVRGCRAVIIYSTRLTFPNLYERSTAARTARAALSLPPSLASRAVQCSAVQRSVTSSCTRVYFVPLLPHCASLSSKCRERAEHRGRLPGGCRLVRRTEELYHPVGVGGS